MNFEHESSTGRARFAACLSVCDSRLSVHTAEIRVRSLEQDINILRCL